jgi:hypothetical protein
LLPITVNKALRLLESLKSFVFFATDRNLADAVTALSYRRITVGRMKSVAATRVEMTFALVRLGWPNTAAILAWAITPLVALAT